MRRQLRAFTEDLQRDRDQQRLDGRKIQGRLDHADSRMASMANQFLAELDAIKHRTDQTAADLRQLDSGVVHLTEALGQLFVEKNFPPAARARMTELVETLKEVFRDRLTKLDWMSDDTRAKALAKFERFTEKIGHPAQFRDYSSLQVQPNDYLGDRKSVV